MTVADHYRSEGARLERKATRERLRRRIKEAEKTGAYSVASWFNVELEWTLARERRYGKKPSGL